MDLVLGLAAVIAPFLGAAFTSWLSKPKRALRWVTLTPISMMEIADEIGDKLEVSLDGKSISNLTKFAFVIHNCGREPIDTEAIKKPLKWKAPGRIVSARIANSEPYVELDLQTSGRTLQIKWQLFNQSCKALIEVLADAEMNQETKSVSAQIRGIPKIKHRSVRQLDEEEIRRRVRRDTAHSPRQIQVATERLNVILHRYSKRFLRAYLTFSLGLALTAILVELIGADFESSFLLGLLFFGSLSILLFFFPREPYRKLLRNRKSSREGPP